LVVQPINRGVIAALGSPVDEATMVVGRMSDERYGVTGKIRLVQCTAIR
jgi:hypothetical protein